MSNGAKTGSRSRWPHLFSSSEVNIPSHPRHSDELSCINAFVYREKEHRHGESLIAFSLASSKDTKLIIPAMEVVQLPTFGLIHHELLESETPIQSRSMTELS